jgi:hypothetical protein
VRSAYRILAWLVAVGVILQAASIAYAWFSTLNEIDSGAVLDANFEGNAGHMVHGMVGMMAIPVVALALFIVSFFAKVAGGVKWAAIVLGVAVLQVLLAFVSFGAPIVGALHGINALVLGGVAARAAQLGAETRRMSSGPSRAHEPV